MTLSTTKLNYKEPILDMTKLTMNTNEAAFVQICKARVLYGIPFHTIDVKKLVQQTKAQH